MFFGMFKGRNEYGFSLIIFSFSSFFMLPGLSSVSQAKSVHEKGHMKSMMAQKVSYRVLAMDPPVVAPEIGEPKPVESQASEAEEVAPPVIESQGVESEIGEAQIAPQSVVRMSLEPDVFVLRGKGASGGQFAILRFKISQGFERCGNRAVRQAIEYPIFASQMFNIYDRIQVEPQAPAFEAPPNVDAAQNAFIGPIIVNVDHNSNNSCCENAPQ